MPASLLARAARKIGRNARIAFYRAISDSWPKGPEPKLAQPLLCRGLGTIIIGRDFAVGFRSSPAEWSTYAYLEARKASARIDLGNRVHANNNLAIICHSSSVSIGDDCLIGQDVVIMDSNFHPINPDARLAKQLPTSDPIEIGDNVFIGSRTIVLKGTKIGSGCTVGAGSVVSGEFPPNSLIAGNPARTVRRLR